MEMISIADITVANKYLRTNTDVDTLIKSIEQIGVINPLVINSKNQLIAGGRRYSALKEMGWDEVPCVIVDEGELKEELISIDENLVRKSLNELEFENCLLRGKEIYETLNPDAAEVITLEDVKPIPPSKRKMTEGELEAEINDAFDSRKTFVQETAEKTGLSERQIKVAILRDRESSPIVKEARMSGEIGAGHANELMKLDHDAQEKILPYIKEKATSVVKNIVKDIQEMGVDGAIDKSVNLHPLTKEMVAFKNNTKKLNKLAQKLMLSDDGYEGVELNNALKEARKLHKNVSDFISFFEGGRFETMPSDEQSSEDFNEDFVPPTNDEVGDNFAPM